MITHGNIAPTISPLYVQDTDMSVGTFLDMNGRITVRHIRDRSDRITAGYQRALTAVITSKHITAAHTAAITAAHITTTHIPAGGHART